VKPGELLKPEDIGLRQVHEMGNLRQTLTVLKPKIFVFPLFLNRRKPVEPILSLRGQQWRARLLAMNGEARLKRDGAGLPAGSGGVTPKD
jgi:hypothetical protein